MKTIPTEESKVNHLLQMIKEKFPLTIKSCSSDTEFITAGYIRIDLINGDSYEERLTGRAEQELMAGISELVVEMLAGLMPPTTNEAPIIELILEDDVGHILELEVTLKEYSRYLNNERFAAKSLLNNYMIWINPWLFVEVK